jgi:hypothetical protein
MDGDLKTGRSIASSELDAHSTPIAPPLVGCSVALDHLIIDAARPP